MLNSEDTDSTRTAVWDEIPELKGYNSYEVTDAWTGRNLGCIQGQYSVSLQSHDVAVLVVKGPC
jgi:alpha-galactosidase